MPYRLLALDVDGTLLDPDGELRDAVRQAVIAARQARTAGRPVHRTALPLDAPGGAGPAARRPRGRAQRRPRERRGVRRDAALPPAAGAAVPARPRRASATGAAADLPRFFPRRGRHPYRAPGTLHPFQREYLQDNIPYCRFVDDLAATRLRGVVMLSVMAEPNACRPCARRLKTRLAGHGHTKMILNKNFRGHILEVLPATVSKWQALERLMAAEGLTAEDVMAIGDDYNDLEMIRGAGLGVAMGNAVEPVRAAAGYVTGSNDEDGVVQAIERFVLRG